MSTARVEEREAGGEPRRRLSAAQRRDRFLDAALEIIADQGIEAVTMEGIAARSGVNKALGYRYFANRDALLIALSEREADRIDRQVQAALEGCETFEQRLAAIVAVYFDAVGTNGQVMANTLARSGAGGPALAQHQATRVVAILQFFADLVTADFAIEYPVALEAAAMFTAGITGLMELWVVTGASRAEMERDCVTMCIGALRELEQRNGGQT